MYSLEQIREFVEKGIQSLNPGEAPHSLYEPVRYMLSIGGKRIRPCLSLTASNIFSDDLSACLPVAMAMEVFHNFTLMHDDIMDHAPLRRGLTTVHEKYSLNTAILSGDVMLVKAFELIAGAQAASLPAQLNMFTRTAIEVCEGQQMDMDFENRVEVSMPEYIHMITLKTAVLAGCSLYCGARAAGAAEAEAQHLYAFGKNSGISFQIHDDMLDVYSNESQFGKKTGGDILNNKKTYLTIRTLMDADAKDRAELLGFMQNKSSDEGAKINSVLSLYEKYNIREKAAVEMKNYYAIALSHLDKVQADKTRKEPLFELGEMIYTRTK